MWTRIGSAAIKPCRPDRLGYEYKLAMIFPRSLPGWISEWDINAALMRCWQTERLPWDYEDGELFWS